MTYIYITVHKNPYNYIKVHTQRFKSIKVNTIKENSITKRRIYFGVVWGYSMSASEIISVTYQAIPDIMR